jgi:hypothetical protein
MNAFVETDTMMMAKIIYVKIVYILARFVSILMSASNVIFQLTEGIFLTADVFA